jgi:hypothetical protein
VIGSVHGKQEIDRIAELGTSLNIEIELVRSKNCLQMMLEGSAHSRLASVLNLKRVF